MKAKELVSLFGQSDGTQWIFVSGVMLGLAGNILISGLAPKPRPANAGQLILSGIFLIASSSLLSIVGWMLQQFETLARSQESSVGKILEVKHRLISAASSRLLAITSSGLVLASIGIMLLIFQ